MKSARWLAMISILLVPVVLAAQSNPVPLIYQPLHPTSVTPGHPGFTLTVHGSNLVPGAVIKANGIPLATRLVNSFSLQAFVPAQAVAKAGTGSITVANPGSIDSNVVYLPVRERSNTIALTLDSNVSDAGEATVGDFNGDQRPDITVSWGDNFGSGSYLDTFLSGGNGKFSKIGGFQPLDLTYYGPNVVGDFNNDGKLDLAVFDTDGSPDTWYDIFLGDGTGGFTAAPASNRPLGVRESHGTGTCGTCRSTWEMATEPLGLHPSLSSSTVMPGSPRSATSTVTAN